MRKSMNRRIRKSRRRRKSRSTRRRTRRNIPITCSKQRGGSGYTFNLNECNPPGGLMEVVRYSTCRDPGLNASTAQTGGRRRRRRRNSRRRNSRRRNSRRRSSKRRNRSRRRSSRRNRRRQRGGNNLNCANCNVVSRDFGCKQPNWQPNCI